MVTTPLCVLWRAPNTAKRNPFIPGGIGAGIITVNIELRRANERAATTTDTRNSISSAALLGVARPASGDDCWTYGRLERLLSSVQTRHVQRSVPASGLMQ